MQKELQRSVLKLARELKRVVLQLPRLQEESRTADDAKNICFSTNLEQTVKLTPHFVGEVLPTQFQIIASMADQESFSFCSSSGF